MAAPTPDECILFVKTVQSTAIRALFETLKEVLYDVDITWTAQGAKLLTMDGAKCACVFMKLSAESFDEYHVVNSVTTGLNMGIMFRLLKGCGNSDTVTLFVRAAEPFKLGMCIHNSEKNSQTTYHVNLLDCDGETLELPDMSFESIITLPSAYFQKLTRDMSNLSDTVKITSENSTLILACRGTHVSQETVIGENDKCMVVETSTDEVISGVYPLRYISLFAKASSMASTIQLFMKRGLPLILQYQCASLGVLQFCVAEKIE